MLYLTAAADVEQQASTFSRFLQQLTWQKALPALLILCDGLIRKTTFGMRQISDKVNLEA